MSFIVPICVPSLGNILLTTAVGPATSLDQISSIFGVFDEVERAIETVLLHVWGGGVMGFEKLQQYRFPLHPVPMVPPPSLHSNLLGTQVPEQDGGGVKSQVNEAV
jgi:hypothetical protein